MSPSSRFRCAPFSRLVAEIARASNCRVEPTPAAQVRYLAEYLGHPDLQARGLLVEEDYVDRHYLEEFAAYYATKLNAPPAHCTRIHVFRDAIDDAAVAGWLERAARGEAARLSLQLELSERYLGFIVVRPNASVPIGRTLLVTYSTHGTERCYAPAETRHDVHLFGLELTIQALPFQQQDRAVGACATTALWIVLSRVLRTDGGRSVTPYEVTQAATRYLAHQRALPAERGLTMEQIDAAIRSFGYEPHHLSDESNKLLRLCIKCYLTSGIPVILEVMGDEHELHHAIVLCGYRTTEDPARHSEYLAYCPQRTDVEPRPSTPMELRARNFVKVYAHDDRLGPYARMNLVLAGEGSLKLKFEPYDGKFDEFVEDLRVFTAIVPLYRKLRLTAEDLVMLAGELAPIVESLVGRVDGARPVLATEVFFSLSGRYLAGLHELVCESDRRAHVLMSARFPRYVGVVRFLRDRAWFMDVVCDTTDIYRHDPQLGSVLAFIPRERELVPDLATVCAAANLSAMVV